MLLEQPYWGFVSVAQLVASMPGLVLDGVVEVMCLNLASGEVFTVSIDKDDLLYHRLKQTYIKVVEQIV